MDSVNAFENYFNVFKDIISGLHSCEVPTDVIALGVRRTAEILQAKGALVRLIDPSSLQLELQAVWGMDKIYYRNGPETNERLQQISDGVEKIHFINDILNSTELASARQAWDDGIRLILEIPLAVGTQILGVMRIYMTEDRHFSNDELDFILAVSNQFACITSREQCAKIMEAQYDQLIKQTEKMSSLGRMASGIAHEINNPLAGILLYSSNLIKKVPDQSPLKEGLGIIMTETTRCKGIIQGLLEFARDREPQKVPADINAIIKKSLQILKNEFYIHHIAVEQELSKNLGQASLDENQIEQVLVNILLNAIQAIDKNGAISIKTYSKTLHDNLKIEISDNGCGIAKEQIDKIFEPFFSTKASGTGLGLAVSYGIIKNHQGHIKVDSRPGQGTRFTITLPVLTSSGKDARK
jgi:signal transduction histidine kinase